jgi:glycosyltransferase involved in cell wall biosynthesis
MVGDYRGVHGCLLHFGSPSLLPDVEHLARAHARNSLVLTWTHGLPTDPDPRIQQRVERLKQSEQYFDKIGAMTTIGRGFLLSLGIAAEKVAHIPLGVNTQLLSPATPQQRSAARLQLGIPNDAICVGSFQKDSPGWDGTSLEAKWIKGPDVLVELLIRLSERYPIYALLTGSSRGYVKERLRQARIPFRHDVLTRPSDLVPYYHALDLYSITSRDEGGPMAFLEAISCGVPVVSTRMGIPQDAIRQGENGFVAEVDDVDNLTELARRVLDNPGLAARISAQARQTALAYDWMIVADQYARLLYDPILVSDRRRA